MLGLTDRQMRRLVQRYRAQGPEGLVSKKRGMRGNHRRPEGFRDHILAMVRERYADFGPTLAREKLFERHGLVVPCETLRGWMKEAGIWLPRAARRLPVQQPRARRLYFGELIQIDGSEHHWFEDRGPYCTALTYVDDATSRLQLLRFVEGESTFDYMEATKLYIERYGKPVALYSDKHTVFRVNKRSAVRRQRDDAVWSSTSRAWHRDHVRERAGGQGPRRTGAWHTTRSTSEGDATRAHLLDGRRQCMDRQLRRELQHAVLQAPCRCHKRAPSRYGF